LARDVTACLTYFKSLTLANLAASLWSLHQQDLSRVKEIVIVDNDTVDSGHEVRITADAFAFPVPVRVLSFKHGDPSKTHAWSTNRAVQEVTTPLVFFTRADYLLDCEAVSNLTDAVQTENQFVVGGYYDVQADVYRCEQTDWRLRGPSVLQPLGRSYDHVLIDSGVWLTSKKLFNSVGGLDESLTAWGHAQTHFQHKLFLAGAEFVRVPTIVFYHVAHAYVAPRDHVEASRQLKNLGVTLGTMWARYTGPDNPYHGP